VPQILAKVSAFLSWLALIAGASYIVFRIWEILHERFTDSTMVAAAILFPVTLAAMPIYAIVEMNDWRLLVVFVATVLVTGLLRAAKRNFERSA
jgi:hypothetical protein